MFHLTENVDCYELVVWPDMYGGVFELVDAFLSAVIDLLI